MDEGMRLRLAAKLGHKIPTELPKHYVEVSEKACYHSRRLHSNHTPPMHDDWIIVMLAELLKERDDRIAVLESQIKTLVAPPTPDVVQTETMAKLDLRTREGRAAKAQLVGA